MPTTVNHLAAERLLQHASEQGIAPAMVSQWLKVPVDELRSPGRLPAQRMFQAWSALHAELGDGAVAMRAARAWTLDDLGLMGFCLATAPTVGDALRVAEKYSGLIADDGHWNLRPSSSWGPHRAVWTRPGPAGPGRALSNEMMVAAFARCFRELSGAAPLEVELQHARLPGRHDHGALLGCDVRFQCAENAVVLSRDALAQRPRAASPAMWRFLQDLADQQVSALADSTFSERTTRLIREVLHETGNRPGIAQVARSLGLSERTLRRQLDAENTSFRRLTLLTCLDQAASSIEIPGKTLTEVALESGFAHSSALNRAWRKLNLEPLRSRSEKRGMDLDGRK